MRADLGEVGGDVGAHVGVAYAVGPELHEQEQQLPLTLDEGHPEVRAALGALGHRRAPPDRLGHLSGVAETSRSMRTRKRSSLPSKLEYSAPVE